jgi:hypothetical protein
VSYSNSHEPHPRATVHELGLTQLVDTVTGEQCPHYGTMTLQYLESGFIVHATTVLASYLNWAHLVPGPVTGVLHHADSSLPSSPTTCSTMGVLEEEACPDLADTTTADSIGLDNGLRLGSLGFFKID